MRAPLLAIASLFLAVPSAPAGSVYFTRQTRATTFAEIANDATLADKMVHDWFLTSSSDILSINNIVITINGTTNGSQLYQNAAGSDVEPPNPIFVTILPALGADSWITTPGATATAGGGFSTPSSTWHDSDNNGAQANFHFARLTIPRFASGSFRGFVSIPSDDGLSVESYPILEPEPASGVLACIGLVGLTACTRRRQA